MGDDMYIESETTKQLDNSLKNKSNISLCGPTGCGKTAIVKSWLKHNEDKINSFYIDCACLKDIKIGKMIIFKDLTLMGQLFDNETIDAMASMPNLVIVADNYHWGSYNIKSHMLLLCDRYIVDSRSKTGFVKLDNVEFVCIIKTTRL